MKLLTRLASRYIAGDTEEDLVKAAQQLNQKGLAVICDFLGEHVESVEKAKEADKEYIHLLHTITRHHLNANISVKLSQLGLDIDRELCEKNLYKVLEVANELKGFVWIDMESSAYTQRTIEIYEEAMSSYPDSVGLCIQSYLRRSEQDVKNLLAIRPSIRLVKGAYKESSDIAFPEKKDVDKQYRKLAKLLISSPARLVAVATHDETIIRDVIKWVKEKSIDSSKLEFEMLYGVRRDLQEELVKEGSGVRIYTPFGSHWLPYTLRRLRERRENLWFAVKSMWQK